MLSAFVREQEKYTRRDLCGILSCSEEKAVPIIRRLKEYGVLKTVRRKDDRLSGNDLMYDETVITDAGTDGNDIRYVFTFVGVICVSGRVLKCFPKYIRSTDSPVREMRQILKVLRKYNSREQTVTMFSTDGEKSSFNLLATLLFILQDYHENGIYRETKSTVDTNGSGEILWEQTINESFMLLSENRPYYTELQTRRRTSDDNNYFRRLHECVVTKASKELKDADLLDLFEMTGADLTESTYDDFGGRDSILYNIEKELNVQYNSRRRLILQTMYAYISEEGSLDDSGGFSLFGTTAFEHVWEDVCSDIMDNCLKRPLGSLPVHLKEIYDRNASLIDLIEKPSWTATETTASATLIPDIVSIIETDDGPWFVIFDAKYYIPRLEPGIEPEGQPGIESIIKQYMYQLAFEPFITDHGFSFIRNCFLMPTEGDEVLDSGEALMKMLEKLGLENIEVRMVPAEKAYNCYLSGTKLDPELLML